MKRLNRVFIPIIILLLVNFSPITLICSTNSSQIVKRVNKTITLKVLLVEFKDVKHRSPEYPANLALPAYTYDDFNNMLFSENKYWSPNMYSPDGEKVFGSLRDYYRIMSDNNLEINGYILNKNLDNDNIPDWIALDSSKSYYNDKRVNLFKNESKEKAISIGLNIETNINTFLVIIYAGHTYRSNSLNDLRPTARYDMHEYIMGERFVGYAPYAKERNDPCENPVSHFAHIGIHAHEFAHLLGCYDLITHYNNYNWDLMSTGNYNGPNYEGARPAPLNPYFRSKLGWLTVKRITKSSTEELKYSLNSPEVYCIEDPTTYDFILVEYRNFNSKIIIGDYQFDDYNSCINKLSVKDGILVWKVLKGGFIKLLHSCGNCCDNVNHHILPGENNVKVITPWSDNRDWIYGSFWMPNTKPSNSIGLEIKSFEADHYVVEFYQENPWHTSPSQPKNLTIGNDQNIRIDWEKNLEPDLAYYKIYKKLKDSEYYLYDSTSNNNYIDINEIPNQTNDTSNYVYYKITSFDKENKESTFSSEIKVTVEHGAATQIVNSSKLNRKYSLEQNYPNPFNPSTIIRYTIPEGAKVNVKVYDVLGNLIEVLVNEVKLAGNYEVVFNASDKGNNYASGVYIFKLVANNFVDIKKGILLK